MHKRKPKPSNVVVLNGKTITSSQELVCVIGDTITVKIMDFPKGRGKRVVLEIVLSSEKGINESLPAG
jgi:hypothetical protein